MRIAGGALLLFLTVLSGAVLADPWKDESGHGRWRGARRGETPGWMRGRGYWDGHFKHRGPPRRHFGHFAPPPFAYRGHGRYVRPQVHFRWDRDKDFDDYRKWQEELRERQEDWWEEQREREEDWREELRERREETRERWRDRFDD